MDKVLYRKALSSVPEIKDKEYYVGLKNKRMKVINPLDVRCDGITFGTVKENLAKVKEENRILKNKLKEYQEYGGLVIQYDKFITKASVLPSNNRYIGLVEDLGYSMEEFIQILETPLYQKIPYFEYIEGNGIIINEEQLNKYKGVLL